MKLQYLGDYRDAFKWDLLHWLCTRSDPTFTSLAFVPLLTPDDPVRKDGQIHHTLFRARPEIHRFVEGLQKNADGLNAIQTLGRIEQGRQFSVTLYGPTAYVPKRSIRRQYWSAFDPKACAETIVFLDPDNGFETKTRRGTKWVLHEEVKWLLVDLPETAAVIVYQHRPRFRPWGQVFRDLAACLSYTAQADAVFEADLAFVLLARSPATFGRIAAAAQAYAEGHPKVKYADLLKTT